MLISPQTVPCLGEIKSTQGANTGKTFVRETSSFHICPGGGAITKRILTETALFVVIF